MFYLIFPILIGISLIAGWVGSSGIHLKVFLNKLSQPMYLFGVRSRYFLSKDETHSLTIFTIGLLFFEIDFEFIKPVK